MPENRVETELAQIGKVSIIKLTHHIIEEAHNARASDIHIDPEEEQVRVRFRIDGMLREVHKFSKNLHPEIISRIKILAGLRTDEHQAAQDGRFRAIIANSQPVDIRVSIAPTYYGENAVLRLLAERAEKFTLETSGFSEENRQKILTALKKPYGIILSTGPTGSGKTTTLYAFIKHLNAKEVSIVTIEDPIEYAINGIEQIQVNSRTDLNFANGLRSILRQDPNIIMVGEIRDAETAGIAVNTALTGHLVLSTLHTNDAATTLPRLLDLKIESYLIASTVNIAISQRLVRKICAFCKTARTIKPSELKSLANAIPQKLLNRSRVFYFGKGCSHCNFSGFFGRLGIHEVLMPDNAVREAVLKKASAGEIKQIAVERGMTTIIQDGFLKAQSGLTTIEEILRTLYE